MKKVLMFGSFDPLHPGHRQAFAQARAQGEYLIVVVARDSTIQKQKGRPPHQEEEARRQAVAAVETVSEVQLGEAEPEKYTLLRQLDFQVLALGYDQAPAEAQVRRQLRVAGKTGVEVVRLAPYKPEQFKSKYFRGA